MVELICLGVPGSPFVVPALSGGGAPGPAALATTFLGGQTGFYEDLAQGASLFQDTAAITPSGVGDPIGRANDYGPGGNNATQASGSARPVRVATAGSFNGSSHFLLTPFVPDTSGITMMARFSVDAGSSNIGDAIGMHDTDNASVYCILSVDASGQPRCIVGLSNSIALYASDIRGAGFVNLAATCDGSTIRLYLDGTEVATAATVGVIPVFYPFAVGARNRIGSIFTSFFDGEIEKAAAVNRVLTPTEISDFSDNWSAA